MLRELGVNITDRYNLNLEDFPSGADYLVALSAKTKQQQERTAQQILHDFRRGRLGKIGLEYPPN